MYLAIDRGYKDIAAMLERKGAKCTEVEIRWLGKKFADFISLSSITAEKQTGKEGPSKQGKAAKQGNGKGKGNKKRQRKLTKDICRKNRCSTL